MTLIEFRTSLSAPEPPAGLAPALAALWRDANGDWDGAHELAQEPPLIRFEHGSTCNRIRFTLVTV